MATERLSMWKIREILRHKWAVGLSHREVAASLGVSVGAVCAAEPRARVAALDWPTLEALDDDALEARLYTLARPRLGPWRLGPPQHSRHGAGSHRFRT